jgi:hypothetical protein
MTFEALPSLGQAAMAVEEGGHVVLLLHLALPPGGLMGSKQVE